MTEYVNNALYIVEKFLSELTDFDEDFAANVSIVMNHWQVENFQQTIASTVFLCAATLFDLAKSSNDNPELTEGYKYGGLAILNAVPEIVGRIEQGVPTDSGKSAYVAGFNRVFHHDLVALEYVKSNPEHGTNNLAKLLYSILRCNVAHKSKLSNILVLDKLPDNLCFDRETNRINIATSVWFRRNLAYFVALMEDMKKNVGFDSERWTNLMRLQNDETETAQRTYIELVNWHKKN